MNGWRQWAAAFSPLPTLAAVVVIVLTCALGNWQLNRAREKIGRAERLARLAALPPLDAGNLAPDMPIDELVDRPIRVRGRFDAAHTVFLENRPHGDGHDSRSGFLVLTPLRIESPPGTAGGHALLVLRGWLPRDPADRTRIAPFPTPKGNVTLEGVALRAVPRVYQLGDASQQAGQRIRQNLELEAFASELGVPLQPFVLQQRSDSGDGLARDWPAADTGAERHYGYAFQWFGLAALTFVLLAVLTWRRARRLANPRRPQPE